MLIGQYPIRTFYVPAGYQFIQPSEPYTNSIINNIYLQISCYLGQLGAIVSNDRIKGISKQYDSYVDYLIMALFSLRNWYNGGFILPNIPNSGTISAYWVQTNTSKVIQFPLFTNATLGGTISATVKNIQNSVPIGYIASVYNSTEVYVSTLNTALKSGQANSNFIYWVLSNGVSGWASIDYVTYLSYEDISAIINNCILISKACTLTGLQKDNNYVSLGQPTQIAISNTTYNSCWLNFFNGVSPQGIKVFIPDGN